MSDFLLVSKEKSDFKIAIIKNNQLWQFFYQSTAFPSYIDDIYLGRIKKITKSFIWVDIGLEALAALRPSPSKGNFIEGQKIVVQVSRGIFEDKAALYGYKEKNLRLTTSIHLAGRYCIYHPNRNGIFFSAQLTRKAQEQLLSILSNFKNLTLRSPCAFLTDEAELLKEIKLLQTEWSELSSLALTASIGLLKPSLTRLERLLRDITPLQKIIFDDLVSLNHIKDLLQKDYPSLISQMRLTSLKEQPLFETFGIADAWDQLHSNFVSIPVGGNIYIEETACVTTIDVNTNNKSGIDINTQAIPFILEQIRLRQLSGNILVDFVRVATKEKQKLIKEFEQLLSFENTQNLKIMGWSHLGFLELQGPRHQDSLTKQLTQVCKSCEGLGRLNRK